MRACHATPLLAVMMGAFFLGMFDLGRADSPASSQPSDASSTQMVLALEAKFKAAGLSPLGTPADQKVMQFAGSINRALLMGRHDDGGSSGVAEFDRLYGLASTDSTLTFLEDDVVLAKARLLLFRRNLIGAQAEFQQICEKYPNATIDLDGFGVTPFPGLADSRRLFAFSSNYVISHPNRTADRASLGLVQCKILAGDFNAAIVGLQGMVPSDARPASEDPIARIPDAKDAISNYCALLGDQRVQALIARRMDKVALLWLARLQAAQQKPEAAMASYNRFIELFPSSSLSAIQEEKLVNHDSDALRQTAIEMAKDDDPRINFDISVDDINRLFRLDQDKRRDALLSELMARP